MGTGLWRRVLRTIVVQWIAVGVCAPAMAQVEWDAATTDVATAESGVTEEELLFADIPSVYGASKYEQKVTEAPSSITIITADEIAKYGYRTLAEILRSVRGFYTTDDRAYTYLGVRGFGRPGDYNTRVLLLIDGHRTNDNVYDSAFVGLEFFVDVDLIDRVEIIRGPSSSLYGTSAFFAVINVITKKGRDYQTVEVAGGTGSHDTYIPRITYGDRLDNGLEYLFSATYFTSDGNHRLFFREFDDPATNDGIAEDADDEETVKLFGEVMWHDFTLQMVYSDRDKTVPTGSYGTYFGEPWTTISDATWYVDLKYEHSFDAKTSVLARLSYDDYWYSGDYTYDWAEAEDPPDLVVNKDSGRGEWWRAEVQASRVLFDAHRVIVGGDFRGNTRQEQKNLDQEVYLDDRRASDNWAVFLQDEFSFWEHFILNAGIRYDHYDTFGVTTNPRLALIYNPDAKTSLKLLYGTAFRGPNAYEFYYTDGFATIKPNPDLDPETIETAEAVVERYLGDHLRVVASVFHYKIEDLIDLQLDPEDELLVFRNLDEVTANGVELELEGKWHNGLEGRVSYTYQDTENDSTGTRLTNSPQHLAKLNVIIPVVHERLFADMEVQYTSERTTTQGTRAGDIAVANLTLFSREWIDGLQIAASVYNLLDEEYFDPVSDELAQDAIEQDGRTFRFKVAYAF
jgi:iron complex outermembrane receptor protein